MPRGVGTLSSLTLTIVGEWGVGWLIVPPVVNQTRELIENLPRLVQGLNEQLVRLVNASAAAQLLLPRLAEGESYLTGAPGEIGGCFRTAVPSSSAASSWSFTS